MCILYPPILPYTFLSICPSIYLSKLNALIHLGCLTSNNASILVYKFRPERTGFNMYAVYTQLQLTFLALVPCSVLSFGLRSVISCKHSVYCTAWRCLQILYLSCANMLGFKCFFLLSLHNIQINIH